MSKPNINQLLAEVTQPRGCRVSHVTNSEALQFIKRVTEAKSQGKNPNIARASEILKESWGIAVPSRPLSEHVRGKCGCRKR